MSTQDPVEHALGVLAAFDAEHSEYAAAVQEALPGDAPAKVYEAHDDAVNGLADQLAEALRLLLADPPEEPDRHPHRIEESAKVYLELDENGAWQVDHLTIDGGPLDSAYDAPLHEACEILGNDGCDFHGDPAVLAGVEYLPDLPNGEEILQLLARKLGKRVI